MKILIVAEHASARFGGEAALPLHYFRVLRALGHAVWLISHARTRSELQALYPNDARLHFVEDTAFHRLMWRLGQRLPSRLAYFTTGLASRLAAQRSQRRLARALVGEHGIEVVHQPMPVSPREPSLLHGLGAPVVIGPMNGGMAYPPGFRSPSGAGGAAGLLERIGRAFAELLNAALPGKRRAAVLLVANERTRRALPGGVRGQVLALVENGVDFGVWQARAETIAGVAAPVAAFVFMGRLVEWKRVDLLLRAFAAASERAPMRLEIVGSGSEAATLRRLAVELGLTVEEAGEAGEATDAPTDGAVTFTGWLAQADCARRLDAADVLVLPSVFECGGAVVLEAMAMGKPVIATAWGGPLDYLDASCGILVEPVDAAGLAAGLAEAMLRLATSPAERARLGEAGRVKAKREHDWAAKGVRIVDIYAAAIAAARDGAAAGAGSR